MGLGARVKAVFFGALGVAGLYVLLGSLNLLRKVALTRVSGPGSVDPGRAEVVGRVEPASHSAFSHAPESAVSWPSSASASRRFRCSDRVGHWASRSEPDTPFRRPRLEPTWTRSGR